MSDEIQKYRQKIDQIDLEILKLLSERAKAAQVIGKIKKKDGQAVYVPSREKKIYDRLDKLNKGPYKTESIHSIFREIISATRALEAPLKISYLGPKATYTHMAAVKYFGTSADLTAKKSIQNIFEEVERKHSDYGVVPVENSTEGVVNHTLDMFAGSNLSINAEIVLSIRHHLLSQEKNLKKIKRVYSHPQAFAQCRKWLISFLPNASLKEVESTAMAAQKASKEKQSAAIASDIAADLYGLPIVQKLIQDQSQNKTRFLIIGHDNREKTKSDKTSLLFTLKDQSGGLYKILEPFAKAKINLTKIESRPSRKKAWDYMFFADIDGHISDKKINRVINEVKKKCALFQILGSYPKSKG